MSPARLSVAVAIIPLFLASYVVAEGEQQFSQFENCPLAGGAVLEDCRVGYRTFGTLNAERSNAVLFPTWFGGTSGDYLDYGYIGPGLFADTSEYFVIAID
ncbi:MAG: hypothetical protein RLN69_10145, partial [Woeseiaceae bacterium]